MAAEARPINRIRGLAAMAAMASILCFVSGCAAVQGRAIARERCESVRDFARAQVDASGLRRAWFLPFGSYEDGSYDFYAPMASDPSDDASKAFYDRKVAQLTHYLRAPEFAAVLAGCLQGRYGYERLCQSQTESTFRASFRDKRTGRSVEIWAAARTTGLLIAEKIWNGDLSDALVRNSDDENPPNQCMATTFKGQPAPLPSYLRSPRE
jgi:hypothetical protein